jgi:D-tyrosyl-tRNA(Tyr) deacylase
MRLVIQRSLEASVRINQQVVGRIDRGLVILVGIEEADTAEDADWLATKTAAMRLFSDAEGKMNLNLTEAGGRVLAISQFTLFASTKKGNRPGFTRAARPEKAMPLYEHFLARLEAQLGSPVERGVFGADMQVALVNDGPVTILIDSHARE